MNLLVDHSKIIERLEQSGFENQELKDAGLLLHKQFIPEQLASEFLTRLVDEINWTQPVIRMGTRLVKSPRLAAWHGDAGAVYRYSGMTNCPDPWNKTLQKIRRLLEEATDCRFNSVLLNYYRSGKDSMGWHRDNERELGPEPLIASISLGQKRKFLMRHIKDRHLRWAAELSHGSALMMLGETQNYWRHCLPKSNTRVNPRVNLTFRQIIDE